MDLDGTRDFARRDRSEVEKLKREHHARRYGEHGFVATLRAAHSLYDLARSLRPDFPSTRERRDDLAHHLRLKRLLDRASHALALR